jgi:Ca2+-binding RTX toxin-like protein
MAQIYGTDLSEELFGTNQGDVIWGKDGWDVLFGFGGADLLVGGEGYDTLEGGAGADWLVGNDGVDTASYESSPSGVNVSLLLDTAAGGDAQGDTLDGIENLTGSEFGDYLAGDHADNDLKGLGGEDMLLGFDGSDRLKGGGGSDTLIGGKGHDELSGDEGNDILSGGEGNDKLAGGAGADQLTGGSGSDWVQYSESDSAVTIDLSVNLASGGDAQGDTLSGIENVRGSSHDDKLSGDGAANNLAGGHGTDILRGNGGADTFTFSYWPLETTFGRDADRIMDFSQAEGDQIAFEGSAAPYTFIGNSAFSGQAGELRYEQVGTNTWVSADLDGDAIADGQILCVGLIDFTAADFDLT